MALRVGIVNDMKLAAEVLRKIVADDPALEVAWIARDGVEAIAHCGTALPDIVLMDLVMPKMNGVEATRRIMAATPCPILVVTATVSGHMELVYDAMGAGAVDVTTTPVVGDQRGVDSGAELRRKIQSVWQISRAARAPAVLKSFALPRVAKPPAGMQTSSLPPLLAIGASTGGPAALAALLGGLPPEFPAAIAIVQHIDREFVGGLATWLASTSPLPVALARGGERLCAGRVLVADAGRHLVLDAGGSLQYTDEPRESLHCPSVDTFFASVALHGPDGSCGVLLTGMGRDGASGLLAMRRAGFQTVAQDKATSVVYGMPGTAAALGAACHSLPLGSIAPYLKSVFKEPVPT